MCAYVFCPWQVEMKDVKDAKFIESLISQNDMRAFVCSNRDDLKLFLDEVQVYVCNVIIDIYIEDNLKVLYNWVPL